MKNNSSMQKVFRRFYSATNVGVWIGYVALAAIVLLVFVDVLGRYFLNKPLRGAYELVLLSMTVLGGFAMMYASVKWAHISLNLITSRLPKRLQNVLQRIISFVGCVVWVALAGQVFIAALGHLNTITDILHIPTVPFEILLGLGILLFSLVLLVQTIEAKHEKGEKIPE